MTDDIDELAKKIRPTDAPPADDRDDAEFMEGFARKFRGGERPIATALVDLIPPGLPLTDLLAERVGPERRPDRELDLRTVEDIDTLGIQIDLMIRHSRALRDRLEVEDIDGWGFQIDPTLRRLRALRDRVAFEAERRRREREDRR